MVGNLMDGIDVVDNVLSVATGGGEAVGPVAFFGIAVIEAGGIVAQTAVSAAATAVMGFHGYPVAYGELIHGVAQGDDNAGILVAGDMDAVGRLARECFVDKCDVGAAHCAGFNLDKHFLGAGFWNRYYFQFLMVRTHQY
jgi:hypothetical protein